MSSKYYFHKFTLCAASIALLTACGGASDSQDAIAPVPIPTGAPSPDQAPTDNRVAVSGLAMNGYLVNALIWVDFRENGTPDGFEPFAYTDNQGYFSYNPNTGTDYCASSQVSEQRFCLRVGTQSGDLTIKATKGIELLSGEAFRSVLTTQVSVEQARSNYQTLKNLGPKPQGDNRTWQQSIDEAQLKVSPLTSLNYFLPSDISINQAIGNLGYVISNDLNEADILNMDYIAAIDNDNSDAAALFAAEVTIARMVDTLTLNLDEATQSLDLGIEGLPLSSADSIYKALAETLSTTTSQVSLARSVSVGAVKSSGLTEQNIASSQVLANAVVNLVEALSQAQTLPSSVQQSLTRLANNSDLSDLIDNIADTAANYFDQIDENDDLASKLLTLNQVVIVPTLTTPIAFATSDEAIAIKALSVFMSDPSNRVGEILNQATSDFVEQNSQSVATGLSLDLASLTADLLEIAQNTVARGGNVSANDLQNSAQQALESDQNQVELTQLADVSNPDDSSVWAGKSLSISGFHNGSEQGQLVSFFNGESTDTSGELILCIAYKNDNDPSDNVTGQRFEGTWSVIGGDSQNRLSVVTEGYNIQMKVLGESIGRDIPSEQQIPALPRMPNELYGQFGFTLNDDTGTWHSDDASVNQSYGLITSDNVPATDEACKQRLSISF